MSVPFIDRSMVLTLGFTSEHLPPQALLTTDRKTFIAGVSSFLDALVSGRQSGTIACVVDHGDGVRASGTLTLSSASGTVGGIINGVTVTVTASGGDTATASALAAAINGSAQALVNQHVTAAAVGAVVTITCIRRGVNGNTITLAATGTGVTASGARLTGGVTATDNTVTI